MNVFIMVDIEGISGIYSKEQVLPSGTRFNEGRKFFTEEINACVSGLKEAGVDKIFVRDCHGGSYSLQWENASDDVDGYVCGIHEGFRFADIEEFDAVILLGYHAMAGTHRAVLEHTFSSINIQNMYVNNTKVGEIAVDAAILGEKGIPVIMVSGDDKACKEAKNFLPGVVTAEVKRGLDIEAAVLMPINKAHQLIHDKTVEAVNNFKNLKPFVFEAPIELKVELTERKALPSSVGKPYLKHIDGRTYSVSGKSVEEALFLALY